MRVRVIAMRGLFVYSTVTVTVSRPAERCWKRGSLYTMCRLQHSLQWIMRV